MPNGVTGLPREAAGSCTVEPVPAEEDGVVTKLGAVVVATAAFVEPAITRSKSPLT
jgi:hypothetical protein